MSYLLHLCCLTLTISCALAVTEAEENVAKAVCIEAVNERDEYVAGFVRLAFHGCVGGCNGCLDMSNPDNAGLQEYADPLEKHWVEGGIREFMSRADFWALCSLAAIEKGYEISSSVRPESRKRNAPPVTIRYGRKDCNYAHYDNPSNDEFPNPRHGLLPTLTFFAREFGFGATDTVAILGAHTLGEGKAENSGFIDEWVEDEKSLDNQYYKDMLNRTLEWEMVNVRNNRDPRWQWRRGGEDFLMLNVDMCLAINVQPDADGRVTTTYEETGLSPVILITQRFARDNNAWLRAFGLAFTKMIETTNEFLRSPTIEAPTRRKKKPSRRPPTRKPTRKPKRKPTRRPTRRPTRKPRKPKRRPQAKRRQG